MLVSEKAVKKRYKIKYRIWMDRKGEKKKIKTSHQAIFPTLTLLKVPLSGHSLISLCKELKQADLFLSWGQLEVPHLHYSVLLTFSWRAASELPTGNGLWSWLRPTFIQDLFERLSLCRSEAREGLFNYLTAQIASFCAMAGHFTGTDTLFASTEPVNLQEILRRR